MRGRTVDHDGVSRRGGATVEASEYGFHPGLDVLVGKGCSSGVAGQVS
jgi:hypothetical protein